MKALALTGAAKEWESVHAMSLPTYQYRPPTSPLYQCDNCQMTLRSPWGAMSKRNWKCPFCKTGTMGETKLAAQESPIKSATAKPVIFKEALDSHVRKRTLPTSLDTEQLRERVGAAIHRRALVSAKVQNARILDKVKRELQRILEGRQNPGEMRLALNRAIARTNYQPPEGREGTVEDLRTLQRQNLIINTNLATARGYGQALVSNSREMVDEYPAWELRRVGFRKRPRGDPSYSPNSDGSIDWEERWDLAAADSGDEDAARVLDDFGRMVALKSSPIWQSLGSLWSDSLGNPYPPFAWESAMRTFDVDRAETVKLGLMGGNEKGDPMDLPGLNDDFQQDPRVKDGGVLKALVEALEGVKLNSEGVLVMASEAKDEGGVWRTINGTPVFIKEGQDVGEAVRERFGKGKAEKEPSKGTRKKKEAGEPLSGPALEWTRRKERAHA